MKPNHLNKTEKTEIEKQYIGVVKHKDLIKKSSLLLILTFLSLICTYFVIKILKENNFIDLSSKDNIVEFIAFVLITLLISGLLSFVIPISWLTSPICFSSLGCFLGIWASRYDLNNLNKFNQTTFYYKYFTLIFVMGFLFFLISNFLITIYLYYKKFKKQEEQFVINKISFVVVNFTIVTGIYFLFFFTIFKLSGTYTWVELRKPTKILGILISSGYLSWNSIYISTTLIIFDQIIQKNINKKYENLLAFALSVVIFLPIIELIIQGLTREEK